MGTYSLEHIIQEWGKSKLTEEQAIGQVLLLIQAIHERLERIEAQISPRPHPQGRHNNATGNPV